MQSELVLRMLLELETGSGLPRSKRYVSPAGAGFAGLQHGAGWPTCVCGVSTFPWTSDEQEACMLLEEDVMVTPDGGESVRFGVGDLLVFAQGPSCTWDGPAPVRKHYRPG